MYQDENGNYVKFSDFGDQNLIENQNVKNEENDKFCDENGKLLMYENEDGELVKPEAYEEKIV